VRLKIKIQAEKTAKLFESMKPLAPAKPRFGVLRTIYPEKHAAVYVNDKFMGHVDEFDSDKTTVVRVSK
jgi:hypothetical protein